MCAWFFLLKKRKTKKKQSDSQTDKVTSISGNLNLLIKVQYTLNESFDYIIILIISKLLPLSQVANKNYIHCV